MSRKTGKTYEESPWDDAPKLGKVVKLKGLPTPGEVVAAIHEKHRKVTLALDEETIDFFKHYAKSYGVPYQKMIRNVLDAYCKQYR